MALNFNICNTYYFTQGTLTAVESGKEYKFKISKDDRFYDYMKKNISNGRVDGLTKVIIDNLFITDPCAEFIKEKSFDLRAIVLVGFKQDDEKIAYFASNIEIKNVSFLDIKSYELSSDKVRVAPMCVLEIPYNTEIKVSEIED